MIVLTMIGTMGVFFNPFWGVAVYYLFAVLRPQFLWFWALTPGIPWSQYVAIATILGGLASFVGCVLPLEEDRPAGQTARFSRAHIAVLLFGGWVLLTYVTAQNRNHAYPYMIEYLKILVMFAVSAVLIRTIRQVWLLFVMAALSLGYIAYEINFLYFMSNNALYIHDSGYGGLDNNGAGLMLAMAVPLCLFAWEGTKRAWRWVFVALIPVLFHAVLMTYSRGAMVSLVVAAPLMYLRSRHRRELTLAALALAWTMPLFAGPEIQARFFTIRNYQDEESARARFTSWRVGWEIAKDYPIFGAGIRNADLMSFSYGADMEGRTIHSQYVQILADNGFVGLGLYLAALYAVWRRLKLVRNASAGRRTPEERQTYALACGIESAMLMFCTGALFLSLEVFELPYLLLLLGAQLGVLVRVTATEPAPLASPVSRVAHSPRPALGYPRPATRGLSGVP